MKNSLDDIKSLLSNMNEAMESMVRMLPQHGDTADTCQRMALINALSKVDHTINGLSESDLENDEVYPPCALDDVVAFGISTLNNAKERILRETLDDKYEYYLKLKGASIVIRISQIEETEYENTLDFYSEHRDSIDESLAYQLDQGFYCGEFTEGRFFINWDMK